MDLVTVTCARDKTIMGLHAHSIDRWVQVPCTHWIVIEDHTIPREEWLEHLQPFYHRHTLKLITDLSPNTQATHPRSGWLRQQAIKLLVSRYINDDTYLILDSKNFFIKPVDLDNWPIAQGNNILDQIKFNWPEINTILDKHNITQPINSWSVTTPFRVKKSIIDKMLELDLNIFLNPVNKWASEFLLYSIFAQADGEPLTSGFTTNLTFWNDDERLHNLTELDNIYNWPLLSSLGLHNQLLNNNIDFSVLINWLGQKGFDRDILKRCLI